MVRHNRTESRNTMSRLMQELVDMRELNTDAGAKYFYNELIGDLIKLEAVVDAARASYVSTNA